VTELQDYDQPEERPYAFVDEENFQFFIGLVIFINIFVLWGETDAPHLFIWIILDNVFLVIFVVEILLRLARHKCSGFFGSEDKWWAYLDTAVVALGIFDLWITPLCLAEFDSGVGGNSTMLRSLRLMRLLRMLRVFKMFSQLMTFVNALGSMVGMFVWIFSVLFMFQLCCAIVLTHLVGHAEALGGRGFLESHHPEHLDDVRNYFKDVGSSMFTLFRLTTTDNWLDIAGPLIAIDPWWRVFFVLFIAFSSWTMISVLTAVASDKMLAATTDRKESELRQQEQRHLLFMDFLGESFKKADQDGNELLDREEFALLIKNSDVQAKMQKHGINLSEAEFIKAWEMLDIDESGELTIDEFVTGLSYLQERLTTKHVVNVDYSLKRATKRCEGYMDRINTSMEQVVKQNEEILGRLSKKERSHEQGQLSLWLWQQWALKNEFNTYLHEKLPELSMNPTPAGAVQ